MAVEVAKADAAKAVGAKDRAAATRAHEKERDDARRRRAPPGSDASAEERAAYELERKKIAKYKEDKLRARRDHTRMILESHAQAKRRALLGKQSEFLATLEFRNALPDLPFDPKFLKYPHEGERCVCACNCCFVYWENTNIGTTDRLIKYKPNTLEADYTYEIHEEANLGLSVDLIDPAKYEGTIRRVVVYWTQEREADSMGWSMDCNLQRQQPPASSRSGTNRCS